MTSNIQIIANKSNSKKGGVKTKEGKSISRLNALKHGLLAEEVLMAGENKEDFKELSCDFNKSLNPEGAVENMLVDRIISNIWRLKRCIKIEKNLMEFQCDNSDKEDIRMMTMTPYQAERDSISDMARDPTLERIMRYEVMLEKGMLKALHELQRIQAKRTGELSNVPLAIDIDVSEDR